MSGSMQAPRCSRRIWPAFAESPGKGRVHRDRSLSRQGRGGWVRRRLGRAGEEEATTMKGSMGIDHITLCVKNLAAAEYLFTKILGFDVIWSARDVGGEHSSMDTDRKSTRLNSSHTVISYAVFCLKKKKNK